jgi:hypothetical protein
MFSIIPIFMLSSLRLRFREKLLVCGLMGLGLLATCAIIPKILSIRGVGVNWDVSWESGFIDMWSLLEICLGIIAASAPPLKSVAENFLKKVGVLSIVGSESKGESGLESQNPGMRINSYRHSSEEDKTRALSNKS